MQPARLYGLIAASGVNLTCACASLHSLGDVSGVKSCMPPQPCNVEGMHSQQQLEAMRWLTSQLTGCPAAAEAKPLVTIDGKTGYRIAMPII